MKTQLIKPLVFLILGCSAMIFQACNKGNGSADTLGDYNRHVDSLKQYTIQLEGWPWRIKSQTISIGNMVPVKLPIDSCNLSVTYRFGSRYRNPNTGYVMMDYNLSSCPRNHQSMRLKNPDTLYTPYEVDIHPNYLKFMDNGYDGTQYKYSILKLNSDSLVLRLNSGDSILTKIYTHPK